MTHSILVDTFEPVEIEAVLMSMLAPMRQYLVDMDMGDYYWVSPQGRYLVERKTSSEIIADSGGRIDDQLRRYINNENVDLVTLLIEGEITEAPGTNKSIGWTQTGRSHGKLQARNFAKPYNAVMGWLWSLQTQWNIKIVYSEGMIESARVIGNMVVKSHQPVHTSLWPYQNRRADLKMPSTFMETILGVSNLEVDPKTKKYVRRRGVGEKTALKILTHYSTPQDAFNAPWADMEALVGKETAAVFFAGIGRYQ